jgi:hypothetical protein
MERQQILRCALADNRAIAGTGFDEDDMPIEGFVAEVPMLSGHGPTGGPKAVTCPGLPSIPRMVAW